MNDEQPYYLSSLAEAYEKQGQYSMAMQHYKRILEINPDSKYAETKIKAIEARL